jgi:3-phenylpropionate/trans-cinnamate dioxygenase ferredoxin reductase subunit
MVIIGGGKAGARAVVGLREHGWTGRIVLVSDEQLAPYDRPPLSKASILQEEEPEPVYLLDEGMMASLKVDRIAGVAATAIDRQRKLVGLADGQSIAYEKLLIATGAKARRLSMPGGERAITLRDFADTLRLREVFAPGRRIGIVGAGFIGLELAASASKRGCQVAVVEMQPRILMRGVPEIIAETVARRHAAAGVAVHTSASIERIEADSIWLKDGRRIEADVLIAGIGAVPEIRLGEAAGLAMDNGIACDARMRTSDPDIYAAGDCCSFPHPVFGNQRMRLEAWRSAQDQAAVAAQNMLGGNKDFEAIPWFWSDQYELSLQIAGMPSLGTRDVTRKVKEGAFIVFHLDDHGTLVGASGIGPGNSIARDVRLAEMLMARKAKPDPVKLADVNFQIKAMLSA